MGGETQIRRSMPRTLHYLQRAGLTNIPLAQLGIRYCFVNLGSDHPSILEAIVKGQKSHPERFPKIITCPNEMVALSMADGYARYTSKPQCVLVHVDVGTQGLAAAVHNASCGRVPVLIFAGLSPYTCEGELRGSRTEYIHWIQDVPDQKQILSQYCRYAGEIKRGVNIKQMVGRAYQFAVSAPKGPVYLVGSREAMEEEIPEYHIDAIHWQGTGPAALPEDGVAQIAEALVAAEEPLVITGYCGRNHNASGDLVHLADTVPGLRVLDTGGSDCCFPASHPGCLGIRYGSDDSIRTADIILVADCDVPFIPTVCKPKPSAKLFHIDCDPLKLQIPVFYLSTLSRYQADASTAFRQLHKYISQTPSLSNKVSSVYDARRKELQSSHSNRLKTIQDLAAPPKDLGAGYNVSYLTHLIRSLVPPDTIFAVEAVTCTTFVSDQLAVSLPGCWINCGGGGLGWSGGAAMGIKLAAGDVEKQAGGTQQPAGMANGSQVEASVAAEAGQISKGELPRMVVQIVGDGTFLFSVPGSVYWIARRYNIPVLTIVLNNKGKSFLRPTGL